MSLKKKKEKEKNIRTIIGHLGGLMGEIENMSLKLNLVSSSSRGHQKRTKKLKERKKKKNWRSTASVAVRS